MNNILNEIANLKPELGRYKNDIIALYEISRSDKIMMFAKARQIAEHIVSDILKNANKSNILEKNIEACQAKGLIPSEICTILHYIRVMGNKQHAGTLKIKISERDLTNLFNSVLRLYEWFFCDFEYGLKLSGIKTSLNHFNIEAHRLIPFFIGKNMQNDRAEQQEYHLIQLLSGDLYVFDDGFCVFIVRDEIVCDSVIDYLIKRRTTHLSILKKESEILCELITLKGKKNNELLIEEPLELEYVMSIHFLDNALYEISLKEKKCIVEPSLLGITDDPKATITEDDIKKAEKLFLSMDTNIPKEIECVSCEDHACFISWANVLFCMNNNDDYLKNIVIFHEIKLQKLWYKLFLYNKTIEQMTREFMPINFINVKKEILKTKIEYSNLMKIDATGASFSNSVRLALNKTSNIEKLYDGFLHNVSLLKEMEELL